MERKKSVRARALNNRLLALVFQGYASFLSLSFSVLSKGNVKLMAPWFELSYVLAKRGFRRVTFVAMECGATLPLETLSVARVLQSFSARIVHAS